MVNYREVFRKMSTQEIARMREANLYKGIPLSTQEGDGLPSRRSIQVQVYSALRAEVLRRIGGAAQLSVQRSVVRAITREGKR
jgi:hypothetical protein